MDKQIDKAFEELIQQRGIHHQLNVTSQAVRSMRDKLNKGIPISMDTKLRYLHASGWRPDAKKYDDKDLVSLLNYYNRTSAAAREKGPEHIVEQWKLKSGKS